MLNEINGFSARNLGEISAENLYYAGWVVSECYQPRSPLALLVVEVNESHGVEFLEYLGVAGISYLKRILEFVKDGAGIHLLLVLRHRGKGFEEGFFLIRERLDTA